MKFTILSHAGMLVESQGISLMTDPWLLGSCYWRSWWNYPKAAPIATRLETLDYIYLTHMHWDHYHGPSLRKLPKSATVLIPEAHLDRMRKDLKPCGRDKIIEIPHGKTLQLGNGLSVTSYQFGICLDSALIVSDGKTTLADMNDCKITGLPLRQILHRHPNVDFMLRSHSSAAPYPYCVQAENPGELSYRTNEHFIEDFLHTAQLLKAKYAIPFASNHCFLHRETLKFNSTAVTPPEVREYCERHAREGPKCVVMLPGDSWSDRDGFEIQPEDHYSDRERRLAEYATEKAPVLEQFYRKEDAARLEFSLFEKYFQKFMASLPAISRLVFKPVVVFHLLNRPDANWVVDFNRRKVYEAAEPPSVYAFSITMHAAVLRDCMVKKMFATFTPSKRLTVELRPGKLKDLLFYWQLTDMYEYDYFPLFPMVFKRRFLNNWARRWRELLMLSGMVLGAVRKLVWRDDPLNSFVAKVR
jgi:UDP-MurNAc hydroxylase